MDEATINEVRQWLHKADHDLRSAARLMSGDDEPLLDTAVYHCQQAAEKALKAYLTAHAVVFSKIHLLSPEVSWKKCTSYVVLILPQEAFTWRYPVSFYEVLFLLFWNDTGCTRRFAAFGFVRHKYFKEDKYGSIC
jgi:hypothetical protein